MLKKLPIIFFILLLFYYFFKEKEYVNNTILLGTSLPKTGINKSLGEAVISGSNAYFKYINDKNLLKKKIKLIAYDDKYEPELTMQNLNKLIIKDRVFTLFGFVGTPTVKKVLNTIENEKIPLFAPFTGASFLRNSSNKYIINFRNSYEKEIKSLITYLNKEKNISKFAVFYQNDNYGEEGYISSLKTLKAINLSFVAQGSYKRNTLSISHAFNEIKDAKPEAIIMIGAYKANSLFIKKAKENAKFKNTIFCNISFSNANEMVLQLKKLKVNTNNILFSQVVPDYTNTTLKVTEEFQTLMKRYYPKTKLSFTSFEAFLAAKVLINSIKKIENKLTKNNLLKALNTTNKSFLQNIPLSHKKQGLLDKVYIFEYINNNFKEINYEKIN